MLELHSAGEDALILYLGHETSPVIAARVQAACSAIETALGDDLRDLVPSAFTIGLLAAIESLLSATVADGMTGGRHRPNRHRRRDRQCVFP